MTQDALTVGIVGTGSVAQTAHIPAWADVPNAEVVAIADPDEGARKAGADCLGRHGTPAVPAYETVDDLLADETVDVVDVTVPVGDEKVAAIRSSLRAGCHVVSQKPFVADLETGRELAELAEAEDRVLTVNHQARFAGAFAAAKSAIDDGKLGTLRTITLRSDFPFPGDDAWYGFTSHTVDLVRFWADREPTRVMAWHKRQTDDDRYLCGVWLDFDDGLSAEIWDEFSSSATQRWSFRVMGVDGIVAGHEAYLDEMFAPELRYTPAGDVAETVEPIPTSYVPDAFRAYFEAVVDALTGDGPVPTPARDNLHTLALLAAAEESFEREEWVDVGSV